jgi:hypothetical protein
LNGEEYEARTVGAIVFPFVRDGELRGIGRVFDPAIAVAMASGQFSTSPCASFAKGENRSVAGSDGVLLIEGDPNLLDHLAIVPNNGDVGGGVWDKGGEAAGIRVDSTQAGVTEVAEDNEKKTEEKKVEDGDKLNAVLDAITGLGDGFKSLAARMDKMEKSAAEKRADYSGAEDESTVPASVRKDDHFKESPQEARERERREEAAMADAQAKCDSVAMAHGERAPKPMMGEKPLAYRRRVLRPFMRHSKEFADADLRQVPAGPVFDAIEGRIFADAMEAARNPSIPEGRLQQVTERVNGVDVVTFRGSWNTAFAPFRIKPRKLAGFNVPRTEYKPAQFG